MAGIGMWVGGGHGDKGMGVDRAFICVYCQLKTGIVLLFSICRPLFIELHFFSFSVTIPQSRYECIGVDRLIRWKITHLFNLPFPFSFLPVASVSLGFSSCLFVALFVSTSFIDIFCQQVLLLFPFWFLLFPCSIVLFPFFLSFSAFLSLSLFFSLVITTLAIILLYFIIFFFSSLAIFFLPEYPSSFSSVFFVWLFVLYVFPLLKFYVYFLFFRFPFPLFLTLLSLYYSFFSSPEKLCLLPSFLLSCFRWFIHYFFIFLYFIFTPFPVSF